MYASAILDMIPWLLFSFTGVYIRVYIARHVNVDTFALVGMMETLLSVAILHLISNEKVIRFLKNNIMAFSFLGSTLDIVRAIILPDMPMISLGLGTVTGIIFCNIVSYGFREMTNNLYEGTDRTLFTAVCEKFGKIGSFIKPSGKTATL